MPEITLSDDQWAELQDIQAELEAEFVGKYGHVRPQDAVQYLLDTYTPPAERDKERTVESYERIASAEYPVLQRVAADVPDVPGSGIDADEMRGKLLSELGTKTFAERLATAEDELNPPETDDTDEQTSGETATTDTESKAPEQNASAADTMRGDDTETDGVLARAGQLLEAHTEKWREVESGDAPYEVTLPDGTTESARTKDDVRRLLFQHY